MQGRVNGVVMYADSAHELMVCGCLVGGLLSMPHFGIPSHTGQQDFSLEILLVLFISNVLRRSKCVSYG